MMKRIFTLLLCLFGLALPAAAQSNNVAVYFASFGQGASNVRSVTVKPFNWSVINGTFYPGDMQSFSIASYPQMTNGSVVFTNQLLGIPFTLTISTLYDSYSTNYCISTNAVADGTGTINCANWVGTFNGIQFFYANVFIGGSGTNSGLTYNFSGNFSVTSNTNVDIGPNVFTNGGQILDAPTGLGQLSIATATRSLNDSSGAAAALWGNRMLYGKLFTPALDWQNLVGYGAWTWMNAGNVFAGTFTGNVANTTNSAGVSMNQVLNTNTLLGMAVANIPAGVLTNNQPLAAIQVVSNTASIVSGIAQNVYSNCVLNLSAGDVLLRDNQGDGFGGYSGGVGQGTAWMQDSVLDQLILSNRNLFASTPITATFSNVTATGTFTGNGGGLTNYYLIDTSSSNVSWNLVAGQYTVWKPSPLNTLYLIGNGQTNTVFGTQTVPVITVGTNFYIGN